MKRVETFAYLGPNRRAEYPCVDLLVAPAADELPRLEEMARTLRERLRKALEVLGVELPPGILEQVDQRPLPEARLAGLVCHTALALQNAAGHRVSGEAFIPETDPHTGAPRYRLVFGHDEPATGERAADLAWAILAELSPALCWEAAFFEPGDGLGACVDAFLAAARPLAAPADSRALAALARRRGIPVLRLEREPYAPMDAPFRVAPNGMLMLGQSRHHLVLDGLFCLQRSGRALGLMRDRRSLWALLNSLGVPTTVPEPGAALCATPEAARQRAAALGYPVRVWPLQRDPAAPAGVAVDRRERLEAALQRAAPPPWLVEPAGGRALDLLVAGGELLHAAVDGQASTPPAELARFATGLAARVDCGLAWLRLLEAGGPGSGMRLAHFDPAPPLARLLESDEALRERALDRFLDWLFPPGTPHSVPIFAVTGTNGKSTTATLIAHAWQQGGRTVGLAQTEGVFCNGRRLEFGDLAGFVGHCRVFENREVDLAVLETARGAVARLGFAWDRCEVAVITNVSEDHLGLLGIHTLDQMAGLKRSILERAERGVVLNADDERCLGMLGPLAPRPACLVSMTRSAAELQALLPGDGACCVLESDGGDEWLVFHRRDEAQRLVRAADIPATRGGLVRFNVFNALAAAAACLMGGLDAATVRRALGSFQAGPVNVPGRLNHFGGLPWRLLIDHGHNPAAVELVVDYVDRLPVAGRRIVLIPAMADRADAQIIGMARRFAGHFDHYVLGNYRTTEGADLQRVPRLLGQGLVAGGVDPAAITVVEDEMASVDHALALPEAGDLLLLILGHGAIEETLPRLREMGARPE